ncbi:MAG: hypothetical protein ABIJ56_18155 [Pseudomonadota bacterium]
MAVSSKKPIYLLCFMLAFPALCVPSGARSEAEGGVKDKEGLAGDLAKEHFKKGVEFFKSGNHEAALAEFLESYRLKPFWSLKFNIGTCYMLMNKYSKALRYFREYLKEGGLEIDKTREEAVLGDMASLEEKVGKVSFCCDLEGAGLVIDDVEAFPKIPEGDMLLDPGIRKIEISKPGHESFFTQLTVVSGGSTLIDVVLEPFGEGKKSNPETKKKSGKEPRKKAGKKKLPNSRSWLIGGLVGGGAIAVAAIATGAMVLDEKGKMEDEAGKCTATDSRDDCPDAYTHQDKAGDLKISTNVLTAAAAAVGALGLIMFLVERSREKKQSAEKENKGEVSANFTIQPGKMIGARLDVRF